MKEKKKRVRRWEKLPDPSPEDEKFFEAALSLPFPVIKTEDLKHLLNATHVSQVNRFVENRFGTSLYQIRRKKRMQASVFGYTKLMELVKSGDKTAIIFFCKAMLGFRDTGPHIDDESPDVVEARQFKLNRTEADWLVNQVKTEIEQMENAKAAGVRVVEPVTTEVPSKANRSSD